MKFFTGLFILLLFAGGFSFSQTNKIAVTIDDLPLQRTDYFSGGELSAITDKLLTAIKKEKAPVIGFVNGGKLYSKESLVKERVSLLESWLDAGLRLGNHTYAHKSANAVSVAEYKEDVIKGEEILKPLLEKRGMKLEYFRHPYLQTGLSLQVKKEINGFLAGRGYTIAPITFDNAEWIFAKAYETALDKNDKPMQQKIGKEYISYMQRKLEYWERQSNALFGRNISQTLLIHANRLNAEFYGDLCGMLRNKGYEFISLEEALKDEAYKSEDTFIKNAGISWLDRWALAMGKKKDFFEGEPVCPPDIMKYAGVDSE